MNTILLLGFSNIFMTFAWYGHLKYGHDWPLWKAILVSWGIALLEYCRVRVNLVCGWYSKAAMPSRYSPSTTAAARPGAIPA
jgi:uncharacterized protein (DUF486 family)